MTESANSTQAQLFKIIAAAGGTGGHIYPAVAVVEALKRITGERVEAEFLGSEDRMETTIIPELGYRLTKMPIKGFRGLLSTSTLLLPLQIARSTQIARAAIRRMLPHIVVCTGAYISYPAGVAAKREKIPLVLMESNLNLGKSNSQLVRKADRIVLAFEESRSFLPSSVQDKAVVLGNPVRTGITGTTDQASSREFFGLDPDVPTLLIFGGSLGARSINNAVQRIVNSISAHPDREHMQLLWQTGKNYSPAIPSNIAARVKAMPYITDMERAFSAADLVVSRSGAATIAELGIVRKPAVLVPLPTASTNEQRHNAMLVQKAGGGVILNDAEVVLALHDTVHELFRGNQQLLEMSRQIGKLGRPNAATDVAHLLLQITNQLHLEKNG